MSPDLGERLDTAVSEAATALAFVEAVPIEDDGDGESHPVVLELIAPRTGTLSFRMLPHDAEALGRVAWGALADGTVEQTQGFLFEFANLVAGRLLADLYPGEQVQIGLPRVQAAETLPASVARRVYDLEGWRLWVAIGETQSVTARS